MAPGVGGKEPDGFEGRPLDELDGPEFLGGIGVSVKVEELRLSVSVSDCCLSIPGVSVKVEELRLSVSVSDCCLSIPGVSVKVGELRPRPELADKADSSAVPCVFAPDDSRVAWSCGDRKVVILPWNKHKNCLVRDNCRDADGSQLCDQEVVLSTGLEVCAMAFWLGLRQPTDGRRGSWKRFDFTRTPVLATGHPNGRVRLWSLETGSLMLELMDHRGAVRDIQFAPDDSLRLVSASADKTLKAWDLTDDGNMFKTLSDCRSPVLRCSWRPDGKQLVACGQSKLLYVFDMVEYKRQMVLEGHYNEVTSCSFTCDGSLIVSSSHDTRAIVWDAETGKPLRTLFHLNPPPRLIFAAGENGAWVKAAVMSRAMCQTATVCEDGLVRFWHPWQSWEEPALSVPVPRFSEEEIPTSCAYNAAGTVIAVGTSRGAVTFLTVPKYIPPLSHLARRAVRRVTSGRQVEQLPLPGAVRGFLCYAH
ncbi:WD repeat and SOCS box-containing protein 1 [Amphibalanus amphitrite]|uniref:WD repeat and SOCS box-containing protein 1 n=1 Tax=Amphibalanus amphitrite TaxID=1232801 RepID=A0A6A4X0R4_AMPAM|nr:WD repeat and SOCS box-containing protein 1 [Amphibalanus amphitrite]